MKKVFNSIPFITIFIFGITIASCKKETPDTETQSSVDNAICEGEFNKNMGTINGFAIKTDGVKSLRTAGPNVYVDPTDTLNGFPVTMVVDYGSTGIEDSIDHKIRVGKIYATFDTLWRYTGAKCKMVLDSYYVAKSSGSTFLHYEVDSINLSHDGLGSFTTTIHSGKCTSMGLGWTLHWSSSRTIAQTQGLGNLTSSDDVYSVTGNSSGVDRNGKSYTVNITDPIIKSAWCPWIEKGVLSIIPDGLTPRTLDYGDGTCDNKATLSISGNTFTFNLTQ